METTERKYSVKYEGKTIMIIYAETIIDATNQAIQALDIEPTPN